MNEITSWPEELRSKYMKEKHVKHQSDVILFSKTRSPGYSMDVEKSITTNILQALIAKEGDQKVLFHESILVLFPETFQNRFMCMNDKLSSNLQAPATDFSELDMLKLLITESS